MLKTKAPPEVPQTPNTVNPNLGWDPIRAIAIYESRTSYLMGNVLTTIDAAIPQGPQNKAVKDTIKTHFREEFWRAHEAVQLGENDLVGLPDAYFEVPGA